MPEKKYIDGSAEDQTNKPLRSAKGAISELRAQALSSDSGEPSTTKDDRDAEPDAQSDADTRSQWRLIENIVMGVRFFSRLSISRKPHEAPSLKRMALMLPIAGLIIAIFPFLLMVGFGFVGGSTLFAAAIGVAAYVMVTGAMHEDGLADSADGLFGGSSPERRLEIMKDSRVGAFGVMAIALSLILRIIAIDALLQLDVLHGALLWVVATIGARSGALWLSYLLPLARADGLSSQSGRPGLFGLIGGSLIAFEFIFAAFAWLNDPFIAVMTLPIAVIAIVGFGQYCQRKVGGQTGDLIGALQQILEIAFLASFMVLTSL